MSLSLTSKTYPVAPGALVVSLLPDGGNGFLGLTALDATTVLSDPANHFYVNSSIPIITRVGMELIALAFSEDGGKTYQALPILIRTPTDDPAYPYGLPVGGTITDNADHTQSITIPAYLAYYFVCQQQTGATNTLSSYCLVRDAQTGAPVFFAGAQNGGGGNIFQWTAQGNGKRPEHWVTTRPIVNPTLNVSGDLAGYRFFPNSSSTYTQSAYKRPPYPEVAQGGSPGLAFGGAETIYFKAQAESANNEGYIAPTQGVYQGLLQNWPYRQLGGDESVQLGVINQPIAQHPHNPTHLLRGSPSFQLAQSFDRGTSVTKIYNGPYAFGQSSEALKLIPPLDKWPHNAHVFFVEDAIYLFGAWGYSVSRDGGQTWPGEVIGGLTYSFNLLRAKGGGYFPDSAQLGSNLLGPAYAFNPIRDDTTPRNIITRNSAPDPANPGGRVNSVQYTSANNLYISDTVSSQMPFTQTAHFPGSFWHAVAVGSAPTRWILLVSHDLGATWEQLPEPPRVTYEMHLVADPQTGWLHWGLQYYSRDGGQTWIANF